MDVPHDVRQLIISHYEAGFSYRIIASMVNRPKSTVADIIQHVKNTQQVSSSRKGICGRPRMLSTRDERALGRAFISNPQATARELQGMVQGSTTEVSIDTIRRSLRRQGRICYRPKKAPCLSAANKRIRLRWCHHYVGWTTQQWENVSEIAYFVLSNYLFR